MLGGGGNHVIHQYPWRKGQNYSSLLQATKVQISTRLNADLPSCLHTHPATFLMRTYLYIYLDIDAMGKPQSGVTVGNLAWFGSYGECQNLMGAHYCLASIKINLKTGNKVSISNSFQQCSKRFKKPTLSTPSFS